MLHFALSLPLQNSGVQVGAHSGKTTQGNSGNSAMHVRCSNPISMHSSLPTTALPLTILQCYEVVLISTTPAIDKAFTLLAGGIVEVAL